MTMPHFLGDRLMVHIDQFLQGIDPGVDAAMARFFDRLNVRPEHVVEALIKARRGDAETVAKYVAEHPDLQAWYSGASTPTTKGAA
jgi:hypothetical protein